MTSQNSVLGLIADPGIPRDLIGRIAQDIERDLTERAGVPWSVEVSLDTFPLAEDGTVPFSAHAPQILAEHRWRYLVYVTDLPRSLQRQPVVAEVDAAGRSSMISLPALGGVGLRARTREAIVEIVALCVRGDAQQDPQGITGDRLVQGLSGHRLELGRGLEPEVHCLLRRGLLPRLRQIAGMVRMNRPLRLLGALSGGIAAALASGGFGVFFGSIWTLSVALSPWRHVAIGAVLILVFALWLITRNRLWFHDRAETGTGRAANENAATLITVVLSVLAMYAVLFVGLGALSLLVIDQPYLSGQLGYAAGPWDYLAIVSLSVSMGLLAGSLGSNFDDAQKVRLAAYSKRSHEQREKLDEYRDAREEQEGQD